MLTQPNSSKDYSIQERNHREISEIEIIPVNSLVVKLYPNPGKDVVNLVVEDEAVYGFEYKLFSISGVLIDENTVETNMTQLHLKQGMYIVKLNYKGEWYTKKLIMR